MKVLYTGGAGKYATEIQKLENTKKSKKIQKIHRGNHDRKRVKALRKGTNGPDKHDEVMPAEAADGSP